MSKPSFEAQLKEVESIIQNLTSESVSVEDLSTDYKKANQLITELLQQLESIEKEIALNDSYSTVTHPETDLGA